ncbi:Prepilin peptidase [Desulfurobacterium thermolithotrophum DSM 11699]|uniref:Prepilin leader peptidase/N-methyltransferase n=1 Tax=Desulfurobacterium thermolithotrophum (strain DSM 11699 / BSA) TaxID=868864 RepID=F0S3J1_DESTD|nr:A24 family peptidase [Desulfurobacterium thermolithotrophum]ADY73413.1 Prepilin peptidase [Desulfurobacterium thermolithotrophum DSM 11699]
MKYLIAFIFGTIIGSFLNVCIHRIPKEESIITPPSYCPKCGKKIKWYDNIPIISYLILKGKCRNCKEKISIQYPLVELLTGFLTTGIVWKYGISVTSFYFLLLTYVLVVVSMIDLKTMLVPVKLCYFAMIAGILFSIFVPSISLKDSILGASFGAGIILFIIETYYILKGKEGMGYGDANVMAVIGAFLGWEKVLLTIFLASLIGAVWGIIFMILRGKNSQLALPFVPFLSLATYVTIIFGNELISWYTGG